MDPKTVFSTFALVFLAELGDKTQLMTVLLSAQSKTRLSVFAGAALALMAATVVGVLLGASITHILPIRHIKLGAGLVFIVLGILLVLGRG
jgi:putative Ca2+/H+ antiporter (TMEM165/GDT1 family)